MPGDASPPEVRGAGRGLQPGRLRLDAAPARLAGGAAGGAASRRARRAAAGAAAEEQRPENGRRARATRRRAARAAAGRASRRRAADRSDEQQARWLLAYLLDWHRREDKAGWWEYFRLRDCPRRTCSTSRRRWPAWSSWSASAIVPHAETGKPTGSVVDRYRYPPQEMEIRRGDELKLKDGRVRRGRGRRSQGAARSTSRRGPSAADVHPTAVFAHKHIPPTRSRTRSTGSAKASPARARSSSDKGSPQSAGRPAAPGRERRGCARRAFAPRAGRSPRSISRCGSVVDLDQHRARDPGPARLGKTFSGARMICALVAQGAKVGVTATSHKVIRNLLDAVDEGGTREADDRTPGAQERRCRRCAARIRSPTCARTRRRWPRCSRGRPTCSAARPGSGRGRSSRARWTSCSSTKRGRCRWPTSLAASAAAAQHRAARRSAAARPAAEGQPSRRRRRVGARAHPRRTTATIPPERGIFLPVTWRLAPSICAFTSELFYDGQLALEARPRASAPRRRPARFDGSGLWLIDGGPRRQSQRVRWKRSTRVAGARRAPDRAGLALGRTRPARSAADGRRHPGRRALQRPGRAARGAAAGHRRAGRDGGQVPGPGGAGRHLLHGDVAARGRAARHGVPLQPEPPERRDVARAVRGHPGGQPAPVRAGVPHAAADGAGQRALPLSASWRDQALASASRERNGHRAVRA